METDGHPPPRQHLYHHLDNRLVDFIDLSAPSPPTVVSAGPQKAVHDLLPHPVHVLPGFNILFNFQFWCSHCKSNNTVLNCCMQETYIKYQNSQKASEISKNKQMFDTIGARQQCSHISKALKRTTFTANFVTSVTQERQLCL
jgi:hypothetical protein